MQSSNLHQANAIMEQVTERVETAVEKSIQRHVANATFATQNNSGTINNNSNLPPALQNLPPGYTVKEVHPDEQHHQANAARQAPGWEVAMQAFVEKMDTRFKDQERYLKDISNGGGNGGGNGGCNGGGPSGGGYCKRKNIFKYCWTHGACAHSSRECSNKKAGHKNEATFSNKLGGSTRFCE